MRKVGVKRSAQPDSSVALCKLDTHTHYWQNLLCGVASFHELLGGLRKSISTISNVCAPSKKFMREATFVLVGPHTEVTLTSRHFPSILTGRTKSLLCSFWKKAEKKWHASEQISFSFVLITFDKVFDRHSYQWSCMAELHNNGCFGRSYTLAMWRMLTLPDQYRAFGYRLLRVLCYLDWYREGERQRDKSRTSAPITHGTAPLIKQAWAPLRTKAERSLNIPISCLLYTHACPHIPKPRQYLFISP